MKTYKYFIAYLIFTILCQDAYMQNNQFQNYDNIGRDFLDSIPNKKDFQYIKNFDLPFPDSIYCLTVYGHNYENALDINNINKFKNITTLNIKGRFNEIPKVIFMLPKIKEIIFSNVTEIDWNLLIINLAKIPQLKSLKIYKGDLGYIPESIGMLKQLERLDFSFLDIDDLPDSFVNLMKLKYLAISNTKIYLLPEKYFNENLIFLDISLNHFNGIPEEINNLSNLESLRFIGNKYYSSDDSIVCKNKRLVVVNLSECGIEQFPIGLKCLPYLNDLSLSDNRLIELPEDIFDFKKLSFLDLSSFNGNRKRLDYFREKMPNCRIWAPYSTKLRPMIDVFK